MDSERVAAIRAALDAIPPMPSDDADYTVWDGYTYAVEDFETQLRINGAIWLRELLTELDKVAVVVAAAREIVADARQDDELVNWAVVILQQVLSDYDDSGSEGGE